MNESLQKAKLMLEKNQYPKSFVNPIIKDTLDKLVRCCGGSRTGRERRKETNF